MTETDRIARHAIFAIDVTVKKTALAAVFFLSWMACAYGGTQPDFLGLVEMYKKGEYEGALRGFRILAENGDVAAQYNVGVMYLNGQGTEYSDTEAIRWFEKAAQQGDVRAQYNAAAMYFNGKGIPIDYVHAYKWFSVLAAQGVQGSRATVARLATLMTPEQLETGHHLYREWAAANKNCLAPECGSAVGQRATSDPAKGLRPELPASSTPTGAITKDGTGHEKPAESPRPVTTVNLPAVVPPAATPAARDVTRRGDTATANDRTSRRLAELEALYQERLITESEYRSLRKRIIGEQ